MQIVRASHAAKLAIAPVVAIFAALPPPCGAELDNLAKIVPQDALAAYMVNPPPEVPDEPTSNSFEIATLLIDQAFAMGFLRSLDTTIRGWLDTVACISNVIEYPHAVMLFDLQVQRDDQESHRVSMLRAALVMLTRGDNKRIERRIQHLLSSYANQTDSKLDALSGPSGGHLFRDQRLPDWLELCWGGVGEFFVITIGEQSFRQCVAAINGEAITFSDDRLFQEGVKSIAAESALVAAQIRFDEIQKRTGLLGARLQRIQSALGMGACQRGLWAAGYAGPSLEIRQWLYGDGVGRPAVIAGLQYLGGNAKQKIPSEATSFAVLGVEPPIWFERIRQAYLQARSRRNAARSQAYWYDIEQRAGLRFSEMFSRLNGPIVVHDYPRHALRLPPAWTIVVPVQGDPALLQKDLDSLFGFWKKELEGAAFSLEKTATQIWYMKVGLEGPAVAVANQHLVISFSPAAVDQIVNWLKQSDP